MESSRRDRIAITERAYKSIVQLNGEAGFIIYIDDQPQFVFVLHASTDSIQTIYVITNPEKLSHLPPARPKV